MFTGIVRTIGEIAQFEKTGAEGARLTVDYDSDALGGDPDIGASVAVDGVCLTVTEVNDSSFRADVSQETLDCTTVRHFEAGQSVNLEPSLRAGDELGGHFVFGHVDDVVEVTSVTKRADYRDVTISLPDQYRPLVARKGSVALDGISLTINEVNGATVTVRIVPHTLEETVIDERSEGDEMNLEIDMLARYVHRQLSESGADSDSLTTEDLNDAGFTSD